MFSNFSDSSGNKDSSVAINTEERVVDSGMSVITDGDLHSEVGRRRSAVIRERKSPD